MIFEQLHLRNFGAFRDPAPILLKPSSLERPVVLVGALNGSGKTTILEALQLVLYGKRSRAARTYSGGYSDYLQTLMHRAAPPSEGAEVGLSFLVGDPRSPRHYDVRRQWTSKAGRIHETLDVFENGQRNAMLSDNWDREVERFIPLNLSELFFFDGEKIESLADPESSARILQTAISSLLGADLIDQLNTDLDVLRRQKARSSADKRKTKDLRDLEAQKTAVEGELASIHNTQAQLRTAIDGAATDLAKAEAKYSRRGGAEFEQRSELHGNLKSYDSSIEEIKNQLRELAAGSLPLRLITSQLGTIIQQASAESELAKNKILLEQLVGRDQSLLQWAATQNLGAEFQERLSSYLEGQRADLDRGEDIVRWLALPDGEGSKLLALLEVTLPQETQRASMLSVRLSELQAQKIDVEQRISRIPPEDAVRDLIEAIGRGRERVTELKDQLSKASEAEREASYRLDVLDKQLAREASADKLAKILSAQDHRVVAYSEKVSEAMIKFRRLLIEHHVASLEEAISKAFSSLWRKSDTKLCVRINPETYQLTLENQFGMPIPSDRLSAGERQLLAVAILWGLAKASGRPLPVVIDTPLGRLDGIHRHHLLTRYFPDASHQVILLSTDTEITGTAVDSIEDVIAHSYTLRYQEDVAATSVEKGYFLEAS